MAHTRDPQLSGIHVLLVDDNEDARYVLLSYLHHFGASVVTARSGGEALAIAAEVRAHVIVSDLSMPGLTGAEFLRQLHALPRELENPTPAIAVTAFDDPATRHRARDGGFAVYLTKPVDPMTVVREVERLFRESQEKRKSSGR
jgi:CheY-like chemotaxis protein